jgi:hypothetical protein
LLTGEQTILNRFSRDVYVIDEVLARVFGGFFRTFASVIGTVVVITATAPVFLLVVVPCVSLSSMPAHIPTTAQAALHLQEDPIVLLGNLPRAEA